MFGLPKEKVCPLLKGECIQARCMFWTHVRGQHPQSGADIDMPDCAVRYLPVLLIENAKEARGTAASVDSFRNEMVQQGDRAVGVQAAALAMKARTDLLPGG